MRVRVPPPAPHLEVKKDIWAINPVFKRPRGLVNRQVHEPEILDICREKIQSDGGWTRAEDVTLSVDKESPVVFVSENSWAFCIFRGNFEREV